MTTVFLATLAFDLFGVGTILALCWKVWWESRKVPDRSKRA